MIRKKFVIHFFFIKFSRLWKFNIERYLVFKEKSLTKEARRYILKNITKIIFLVTIMKRSHPFPSRTRQLSSSMPKILSG